jgi:hypothetical protein
MARFFFHVHDDDVAEDEEGRDLPDRDAAVREALIGARSLACEEVANGCLHHNHRILVTQENGEVVATVTFADAVTVEQ